MGQRHSFLFPRDVVKLNATGSVHLLLLKGPYMLKHLTYFPIVPNTCRMLPNTSPVFTFPLCSRRAGGNVTLLITQVLVPYRGRTTLLWQTGSPGRFSTFIWDSSPSLHISDTFPLSGEIYFEVTCAQERAIPFWCSAENHVFTGECTCSHCQRNGGHWLRYIEDFTTEPRSLSESNLVWNMTEMKTLLKDTFKMCRRFWSLYTCMNLWSNLSVWESKCCHGRRIMVQNTKRL